MARSSKIDMTQGRIIPLALRFALPLCIGNILQQLYLSADMLIVGNYCTPAALAALGTSGQPVEILLTLFMGIGAGVSILVAQHTGAGETAKLSRTISTAISFLYLAALPLTVLGVLLGPLLLQFMDVPPDTYPYARVYMSILFAGTLGNLGYNLNAGVLRGMGDSSSSLYFLVISALLNIVLDLLFVAGFHMDVFGAALATIIAQITSWLLSILYIRRKYPHLGYTFWPRTLDLSALKDLTRVGIPLGVNNSFYSVGHLLMQRLINAQGSTFIAACAVGSKLIGFANIMIGSLCTATATYSGQNFGARRFDRLRRGLYIPLLSAGITLTGGVIVLLFARPLVGLITPDPLVQQKAMIYLYTVQPFTWCYALFSGMISLANGLGAMRYPTVVNLLALWVVRIPAAWLIGQYIGGEYVTAGISVSFVFGMCAMLLFLRSARWRDVCRQARLQTS